MPIAYGTSYYALKDRGDLRSGETLLVLGASGGVGLAAVQLGKIMGARVIACASSPEKLALCRSEGADELIDYAKEDLREAIKRLTGGKGVDVVLDPVGGPYAEPCVRGMAWKGRYLVVGFAAGEIPKIPLNLALWKGCSIVGVACLEPGGSRDNFAQLIAWAAAARLKPLVSVTRPLARTVDALNDVKHRRVQGKIVILP
jgi:NADPH2:quinone reductase